ncbi:DNA polymerase II [Thermococcus sp. P6]|uniref:DNA-directed DNA polymerase II small subunit n=1 Tax=Thermococcus sp. P6 TaxID=122420 RepID=UPI000B59A66D|nr:DNA-directed DNA polymerase II small subunit [Thermococcus sp. P6]ASJ10653.1 DNA polymerase II [Thermococcus sp. P6]
MGLIEDLMANNYLITPSAYYLLTDSYGKDFTLAELIKFAKARGTFVIDHPLAKDFLAERGLLPVEVPSGGGPSLDEYLPRNQAPPEEVREEGPGSDDSDLYVAASEEQNVELPSPENTLEGSISTGTPPENSQKTPENSQLEEFKEGSSGGESYISTGTPGDDVQTGTVAAPGPELESAEDSPTGNGYANDEGRGGTYDEYGVPVVYEEEIAEEGKSYSVYSDFKVSPKEGFHYRAREIPEDYEIVFDVKNLKFTPPKAKSASGKEGDLIIKTYSRYFRSRLTKMRRIFRENPEIGGVIDIGKLGYVRDEEVTIIGLVNQKRETAKGFMFEVEDRTGVVRVFINRNNEESKKFFQIMPDSVVGFRGRYSSRGIFFANRIYLPDVPKFRKKKPPLEEKVYAILLSDVHVGSNKFCEKAFMRFLEWLNGDVNNPEEEELVSRIKYMVLAGDVVDGVGIYPGQYNELAIPDIFDQYEALANLLSNVPDHITMFIGPGNHDAARPALPQPGFYEEYAKPLLKLKNAVVISNPAVIRLHGRDFLIAHGRGIEDVVNIIPNRSHHRPAEAMVDLLKLRHLAPTFGERVPIAPDPEDTLVIESVPDLFQSGHVHVMEYKIYNDVFLINTGTWQAQTEFQKMVNIVPTPARVPVVDVETARLRAVIRFDEYCEGV